MKSLSFCLLALLFGVGTRCGAEPSPSDRKIADKNLADYFRLSKVGEEEQALKCINTVLKLNPSPSSYRERADLYLNMGKNTEAMADARFAEKFNPKDPETERTIGRVLAAQGKTQEAIKLFDDAVAGDPKNKVFRFERARLYERNHDYAKAAADYTVTIDRAEVQNRAKYFEFRGMCYLQTKEYKKAIGDFTAGLAISTGRSKLLRSRALAYKMLGNTAMQQKDLKAAAEMDETFEPPKTMGQGR